MAIDVKSLPPAYQVQALRKLEEQERRKKRPPLPCPAGDSPRRGAKYHNAPAKRVTDSGAVLRFDSQKEARRYDELAAMERAGVICDLRMQVDFTLQEAYTDGEGRRVRAIRYRADFTYCILAAESVCAHCPIKLNCSHLGDGGCGMSAEGAPWVEKRTVLMVEDVKSRATRTKEYIMKRKLMKERFGIEIQEV